MYIDSHAHLDDRKYDADRHAMLMRARQQGVIGIINVGYDLASSKRSVALAEKYDFIYAAVGIHPHDAKEADDAAFAELRKMAAHPKVVAIGEMGLDYYRDLSPRLDQQRVFLRQIDLAKETGLPVIIHDRDAHGDVLKILKEEKAGACGGVLHCFSGSWEMANECIGMGFHISIAGPVTFNNAGRLKDIAALLPSDRLLIETDAPYLTPEPHRGKRNESAFVLFAAAEIARLRGIAPEELGELAAQNTIRLFKLNLHCNKA
jgi:TatD DNase family protein